MRVSALPRRSFAVLCLAVLALSTASLAGAVVVHGGVVCGAMATEAMAIAAETMAAETMAAETMAATPADSHTAGHSCAPADPPPMRLSGCSNAPCCVLSPEGAEPAAELLPAPSVQAAVELEPPVTSAVDATVEAEASGRPPDEARASSGRERLTLHAVLLI